MTKSHLFYINGSPRARVARAEGVYFWDEQGRRYLDGSSGPMLSNLGHGHPEVLEAMREQMSRATFAYRLHFENEPAERFAAELVQQMPKDLDRVFFASGGSETVETCLKLARQYALARGEESRWKVISLSPCYHGCTLGLLGVSSYAPLNDPFKPMVRSMPRIPAPTAYRDRDGLSMGERGLRYANNLESEIVKQDPETVLAFIMEPVGGASTGALVGPDPFHCRIREICDEYGVLLIYDEVMSGVGRTGTYLAAEQWGITPDLVALSKGIAAGYCPLGAMVARTDLVDSVMDSGEFQHGYSYAGNPLACTAGWAVLRITLKQRLLENAARQGDALRQRLHDLQRRFPVIGDVRGRGLLLAFELVADAETWEVLPPEWNAHQRVVDLAYERGLILYSRRTRGGYSGDHLLVCPPLIITSPQLNELMEMLTSTLVAFTQEFGLADNGPSA